MDPMHEGAHRPGCGRSVTSWCRSSRSRKLFESDMFT